MAKLAIAGVGSAAGALGVLVLGSIVANAAQSNAAPALNFALVLTALGGFIIVLMAAAKRAGFGR